MDQKNKSKHKLTMFASIFIIIVIAFFAGTKYQASKAPSFDRNRLAGMSNRGMGQAGGVNMLRGEINQKDGDTLTIKLADGSSKIVFLSDTTTISKSEQGTGDDLVTGNQVVVFGQTNSDGSVTAQNIQLGTAHPTDFRPGAHSQ